MKLISCDGCGVVLDADKLSFPTNIYKDNKDNGEIDYDKAYWDGVDYIAKVECPICSDYILEP